MLKTLAVKKRLKKTRGVVRLTVELTADYLRHVRFKVRRGNTYDAGEVDAFMDALIAAVEARAEKEGDAAYTARLEAICEIRAEMTEQVMRAMLEAEKKIAPILAVDENY